MAAIQANISHIALLALLLSVEAVKCHGAVEAKTARATRLGVRRSLQTQSQPAPAPATAAGSRAAGQPLPAPLAGARVTGLLAFELYSELNWFDRAALAAAGNPGGASVPQHACNYGSPIDVAVEDGKVEFVSQGQCDDGDITRAVDLSCSGLISFSLATPYCNSAAGTITLTSRSFSGCSLAEAANDFIPEVGSVTAEKTSDDTVQIWIAEGTGPVDGEARFEASWQLTCWPRKCDKGECCHQNEVVAAGTPCSKSTGCFKAEVCNGVDAVCPASEFKPEGTWCPWRPRTRRPYEAESMSSPAEQETQAVTAEQAAAWLTGAPDYETKWPACAGKCYTGVCALEWDHPACCFVLPEDAEDDGYRSGPHAPDGDDRPYATELSGEKKAELMASGYWRSHNFYCWK